MKKVVVTGGTGFIGSWLIQELLNNDISVTAIVRNRKKILPEFLNNGNLIVVQKDILEIQESDFLESEYDCFFHLAWSGVSPEFKNDVKTQLDNIAMSIHAIEIAKNINCKKFISAGTVGEYVFCDGIMDVYERQTPNDIYGASKVSAYYFLEVRARQLNIPFVWLILPSTFGERRNDNNIISYTIRSLLNGERPSYGNLEQMWDFLYVGEVVRAIRLVGEKGKSGRIYGIGSGEYRHLNSYIEEIRDMINPTLELGIGDIPTMSKKAFSSCVNIDELTNDTGFVPQISFAEGIRKTIEYFKYRN